MAERPGQGGDGTDSAPSDSAPSNSAPSDPAPYDHLRPADPAAAGVQAGVYRVVGTGDPVALLRVGDADGRRVTGGTVVTVDRDALAAFEPDENPDGNRPAGEVLTGAVDTLGWQVRAFVGGLRARPLASLAAIAVVLAGVFGQGQLPGPDLLPTVLVVAGTVALAYVVSSPPAAE